MNEKGQLILTLILVMTVALAIGLSVVQKSLVDVSTSTKVEQSSRAFSAAEAGIEKALRGDTSGADFPDIGSKTKEVLDTGLIPCIPGAAGCSELAGSQQAPLEYPPLSKESVAHVWLADLNSVSNPPAPYYTQGNLDVYWGNSVSDKAALELTLVYYDGTKYTSRKWYLDHTITRTPPNGFEQLACSGYSLGFNTYQCKRTIGVSPDPLLPSGLMLMRARLLYNTTDQPLAVRAVGTCGLPCSLPPQAKVITSTGVSGETQRRIQVFQENKVVPPYFDYAIFSAGEIKK